MKRVNVLSMKDCAACRRCEVSCSEAFYSMKSAAFLCIDPFDRVFFMKLIRKHIVFRGTVQGVGFRWRARHAADLAGATGWVRNEYDGSVTMEIQGTEEQIDCVIRAVESGRFIEVGDMDVRTVPVVPDERCFTAG